jgi:hypothetical protein
MCVLEKRISTKKTFLSAALDCSLSSPDAVWRACKEGDSCQGKCNLMQQCKKRPENASGRNCGLDVTLTCSNGVETRSTTTGSKLKQAPAVTSWRGTCPAQGWTNSINAAEFHMARALSLAACSKSSSSSGRMILQCT